LTGVLGTRADLTWCARGLTRQSDNGIGDTGVVALAQVLLKNRGISVLELGFNGITATGLEFLCQALRGYTALKALHLDNNDIGGQGAVFVAQSLQVRGRAKGWCPSPSPAEATGH
jgi:Ran GTPase-activating protein (RanGAP) involved in mRNA processing and transport